MIVGSFLPCTVFARRAWVFPTFGTGQVLTQRLYAGNPGKMKLTTIFPAALCVVTIAQR